jgi:hypothetical protein
MNPAITVAIIAVSVALLTQAGAMLYWGGQVRQMLRDHERRLTEGGL